jgi:hypothetical protein
MDGKTMSLWETIQRSPASLAAIALMFLIGGASQLIFGRPVLGTLEVTAALVFSYFCYQSIRGVKDEAGLTDGTRQRLEMVFVPELRKQAEEILLKQFGTKMPGYKDASALEIERVRFAALKLSEGSLAKLREQLDVVSVNPHDLLVKAEFLDIGDHLDWWPDAR